MISCLFFSLGNTLLYKMFWNFYLCLLYSYNPKSFSFCLLLHSQQKDLIVVGEMPGGKDDKLLRSLHRLHEILEIGLSAYLTTFVG